MRNFKRLNPRGPAREIRQAINELAEILKRQRVAQGIGYKVKESSTGTRLEIDAKTTETTTSEGMHFEGEYDAGKSYTKDAVVVVRGGTSGGTYIAIVDVPANNPPEDPAVNPESGIFWVALARDQAGGAW